MSLISASTFQMAPEVYMGTKIQFPPQPPLHPGCGLKTLPYHHSNVLIMDTTLVTGKSVCCFDYPDIKSQTGIVFYNLQGVPEKCLFVLSIGFSCDNGLFSGTPGVRQSNILVSTFLNKLFLGLNQR